MGTLRYRWRLPPVPMAVSQRPRLHPAEQLLLALSCSRDKVPTGFRPHHADTELPRPGWDPVPRPR